MMTTAEIKSAIFQMQSRRRERPTIWENQNGTFSHHRDAKREWADENSCRTDLRFHQEWAA